MTHHNGRPALWQKARRTVGHHSGMKRLFLQTYVFAVCTPPETKKIHLQNVRVYQKKRLLWGFILLLFFKSPSPPHLCRTLSLLSLSLSLARTYFTATHKETTMTLTYIPHTAMTLRLLLRFLLPKRCESCQTAKPFLWMAHTSVTTCQTEQATDTALTLSASLGAQSK